MPKSKKGTKTLFSVIGFLLLIPALLIASGVTPIFGSTLCSTAGNSVNINGPQYIDAPAINQPFTVSGQMVLTDGCGNTVSSDLSSFSVYWWIVPNDASVGGSQILSSGSQPVNPDGTFTVTVPADATVSQGFYVIVISALPQQDSSDNGWSCITPTESSYFNLGCMNYFGYVDVLQATVTTITTTSGGSIFTSTSTQYQIQTEGIVTIVVNPVIVANVMLNGLTQPLINGQTTFGSIPPGTYTITVGSQNACYSSYSGPLVVTSGVATYPITLSSVACTMLYVFVSPGNFAGENAYITQNGAQIGSTQFLSYGEAVFGPLTEGTYQVYAISTNPCYQSYNTPITLNQPVQSLSINLVALQCTTTSSTGQTQTTTSTVLQHSTLTTSQTVTQTVTKIVTGQTTSSSSSASPSPSPPPITISSLYNLGLGGVLGILGFMFIYIGTRKK